ncbi:ribulose-phosphate 3-epimerase [Segnochrobactrum spirostomi]|uniref:Ribulose-phosphate 3-epimerase n=1 Tax=Segnochrobactrum spirostomi TaxID=2608987 RepID=A0A6A7Y048_9HYPH|nr:ribulose-phosphate 3-epimerase [Segnochrobactrum spirostomi]MQT11878.1 ribulose-phosphate 3-epimerase [Segnochrobactrum spirostomi]
MTNATARFDVLPKDRLLAEFSLWSADLIRLADDVARSEGQADVLHVDVADGHFAPAFLFFPDQVARVRAVTNLPIHVHLMVDDAILIEQIRQFAEAGADIISIHVENRSLVDEGLALIAELGCVPGVVLRVETPVEEAAPLLDRVGFLTLLGTAIGVKGQSLSETATGRLEVARRLIAEVGQGRRIVLAADGGIREHTVPLLRAAGAETVVMGSLAYGAPDLAARIAWVRGLPAPEALAS